MPRIVICVLILEDGRPREASSVGRGDMEEGRGGVKLLLLECSMPYTVGRLRRCRDELGLDMVGQVMACVEYVAHRGSLVMRSRRPLPLMNLL